MAIKDELIEKLKTQLKFENDAKRLYLSLLPKLGKDKEASILDGVIQDEIRHATIVDGMLEKVKAYDPSLSVKPVRVLSGEEKGPALDFEGSNSILFISPLDSYMHTLTTWLKANKRKVIYVSYAKISKHTQKLFKEKGLDMSNIEFLECSDGSLNPRNLSELTIQINFRINELKDPLVVFDSLSGFLIFHQKEVIQKFVLNFSNQSRRRGFKILWILFAGSKLDDFENTIAQVCDSFIKV